MFRYRPGSDGLRIQAIPREPERFAIPPSGMEYTDVAPLGRSGEGALRAIPEGNRVPGRVKAVALKFSYGILFSNIYKLPPDVSSGEGIWRSEVVSVSSWPGTPGHDE